MAATAEQVATDIGHTVAVQAAAQAARLELAVEAETAADLFLVLVQLTVHQEPAEQAEVVAVAELLLLAMQLAAAAA